MTVVIADTSPLNYLVIIGEVELLPRLYGQVLIPEAVALELTDPDGPPLVAEWASRLPSWLQVCPNPKFSGQLSNLDEGERAAILLAETQQDPVLLLIDDADGRIEAERRNLATTGTIGVLRAAAIREMVDLPRALGRLKATNFRCSPALIEELLIEARARRARRQT